MGLSFSSLQIPSPENDVIPPENDVIPPENDVISQSNNKGRQNSAVIKIIAEQGRMLICTGSGTITPSSIGEKSSRDLLQIRVATFNIRFKNDKKDGENRWENRKDVFFEAIENLDADLIGFQEVVDVQYDELAVRFQHKYGLLGVARQDGHRLGEFCCIAYSKAKFIAIESGTFWLSQTPNVIGTKGWDANNYRICTWARLKFQPIYDDNNNYNDFLFANTHIDHKGMVAKQESIKLLSSQLSKISLHNNLQLILTGDFNIIEDNPFYQLLVNPPALSGDCIPGIPWVDSYREVHPVRSPEEATKHGFCGRTAGSRIDYIFHTPGTVVTIDSAIERYSTNGRFPSDHYPVSAVLQIMPATNAI